MTSKQRGRCSLGVWSPALLLLLLLVQLASTQNADCPHECIPLTECPELLKLLENKTPRTIRALKDATCVTHRIPTVCCPESTTLRSTSPAGPTSPVEPTTSPVEPTTTTPSLGAGSRSASLTSLLPKRCGQGPDLDRIHGGTEAPIDGYPWMAVFGYLNITTRKTLFLCSGAVINERYVLTAAHCVQPELLTAIPLQFIRLGEWDLSTERDCVKTRLGFDDCAAPVQDFTYEDIIIHPDYNVRTNHSDDIALIRVSSPIDLSGKSIQPVCLPPQNMDLHKVMGEREAVVAGWGFTETGQGSNKLLHVFLPHFDIQSCNRTRQGKLVNEQMCFGGRAGQDSCKGDSGGPLMLSGPRGPPFLQIGVVSYGAVLCGTSGSPGVYTSVAHYRNWIEQNLKP